MKRFTFLPLAICGFLINSDFAMATTSKEVNLHYKIEDNHLPDFSTHPEEEKISVTGVVLDEHGTPMPGISVKVKGLLKVTYTDKDGKFKLTAPRNEVTLIFTYVGYKTQTVPVKTSSDITVTLEPDQSDLNEVVVLGSRGVPRTQLDSAVPVDILDIRKLAKDAPQVTLGQILNYAAPSFSTQTTTTADATDFVDPISLRGLGSDQVLVLVNGKRRYSSALISVTGSLGKGSSSTDLNAIPVSAIEKIEILRDGAAAQYGSDAIAGVINVVLRKDTSTLNVSFTGGGYFTKSQGQNINDGKGAQATLNYGLPIGDKGGFINFSGSYDHRSPTNRAGEYNGVIYTNYPGGTDGTADFLKATNTTRKDYGNRYGQSELRSGQLQYNAEIPVSKVSSFYSFGGLGYRNSLSPGLYRYPNDAKNVLSIYPLGFLPEIGSKIYDRSLAAGIRGKAGLWNVDFSNTFGQNLIDFSVENSLNASLLDASPTSFYAGGLAFTQNTLNADVSRKYDVLSGINLAFGGEYRFERFQILEGAENSYTNYGTGRYITTKAGDQVLIMDPSGPVNTLFGPDGKTPRPGGAQVFPGFTPQNAVDASRTSVAGYADLEVNLSNAFLANAAIRYENYSDFGSTTNGKLALRYKVTSQFSLRASASTGFRAPSLQQRYYTSIKTSLDNNGTYTESGTFANNSRVAKLVGIPNLRPERSKSISAGITGNIEGVKISVDGYFTRINDRIIYTGAFTGSNKPDASASDKELYDLLKQANATNAQFFTNAINTETKGIDAVVSYTYPVGQGTLRADVSGTISKTRQVGAIKVSEALKGKETTYLSNSTLKSMENAAPNQKANLTLTYGLKNLSVFLRNNYFGKVTEPSNIIANQEVYSSKWVTDFGVGYGLSKAARVTVGANNLFNVYPDKVSLDANNVNGQLVYSKFAQQFGFNGRYLFARLEISL